MKIIMKNPSPNIGPGSVIKDELKSRGISQKDFARAIGVAKSYFSDVLSGRRRLSLQLAEQIESLIGIPSRQLMDLQTAADIVRKAEDPNKAAELEATELLAKINQFVCVKSLVSALKIRVKTEIEKLNLLQSIYGIGSAIERDLYTISKGCFRKSVFTGLDERMAMTWVLMAVAASNINNPLGTFDREYLPSLCKEISSVLHRNINTLFQLEQILSKAGIGLLRINKVEHASIDGFSFFRKGVPYIAITCRYDRIDNLAFTLMHELGHIYLGHTNYDVSSINIDVRSFDDEVVDDKELEADQFAANHLIDPFIWKCAPKVCSNPWIIQSAYTQWARANNLNEWIVLGRLSFETGMYKFKSDETRKIHGGKEVCHEII
ncbi:MAG: helix-turn-helix domain-containing protein [Muribaculaceae bacterium]